MEEYPLASLSNEPETTPPCSDEWLKAFVEVMGLLCETFRAEMSPGLTIGYRRGLADLTPQELRLACDKALQRHPEYMPTPAQVRQYLTEARAELPKVPAANCCKCGGSGWYAAKAGDIAKRCKHEA